MRKIIVILSVVLAIFATAESYGAKPAKRGKARSTAVTSSQRWIGDVPSPEQLCRAYLNTSSSLASNAKLFQELKSRGYSRIESCYIYPDWRKNGVAEISMMAGSAQVAVTVKIYDVSIRNKFLTAARAYCKTKPAYSVDSYDDGEICIAHDF